MGNEINFKEKKLRIESLYENILNDYAALRETQKAPWIKRKGTNNKDDIYPIQIIEGLSLFIIPLLINKKGGRNIKIGVDYFIEDLKTLIEKIDKYGFTAYPYLYSYSNDQFVEVAAKLIILLSNCLKITSIKEKCLTLTIDKNETVEDKSFQKIKLADGIKNLAQKAFIFITDAAHSEEGNGFCYWGATDDYSYSGEKSEISVGHTFFSSLAINGLLSYLDTELFNPTTEETKKIKDIVKNGVYGLSSLKTDQSSDFFENIHKKSSDMPTSVFALDGLLSSKIYNDDLNIREKINQTLGPVNNYLLSPVFVV